MAETPQRRRGSYAKGVAKREEILARALAVIAREGYRGASVKELADAVGLSQAGLLHYFGSKEELFTEILRKRDEVDAVQFGHGGAPADVGELRDGFVRLIKHNAEVPGLVELFSRMAVEAAEPRHPGHRYFLDRGENLRRNIAATVASAQHSGQLTDRIAAGTVARLVQAVSDGMQLQWMLDPSIDMSEAIEALFEALTPEKSAP